MSYRFSKVFTHSDNLGDKLCFRLLASKEEHILASFGTEREASIWIHEKWELSDRKDSIMFVCAEGAMYNIQELINGVRAYFKEIGAEPPTFMFKEAKSELKISI